MPSGGSGTTRYDLDLDALESLDSMEGMYAFTAIKPPERRTVKTAPVAAYLLVSAVTALAYLVHYLPVAPFRTGVGSGVRYPVSAAIIAILAGMAVRNSIRLPQPILESCRTMPRKVIPPSIVLAGAGLNLTAVATVGVRALLITLLCIAVAMAASIWLGALTKLWRKTALLIGAGTAICGTSAIIAVAPLIDAEDQDIMLAVGTVNILGLVLMFLMPLAGALLKLTDQAFGVWTGTSIHAVPQVVAAAYSYSPAAGALATLVKLVRVGALAPFILVLSIWQSRQPGREQTRIQYGKLAPPFVLGFLVLAVLNTAGLLPILQFRFDAYSASTLLTNAGELLLTVSMAAMGLEVDIAQFSKLGGRAILVGSAASLILCGVSLLLIRLLL